MNLIAVSLMALAVSAPMQQRPAASVAVPLHRGMVITHSVRIKRGVYSLPASPSLDSAVIVVRGTDITIDFDGAELRGTSSAADPDAARGVGVRIEGGSHVRLLNARVRGYKIGLLARHTRDLRLIDNDFSYNWKPRLYSLIEHESLGDWLSHHHDESEEWMRFGAGAFLSDVHGGEVRGNRIEQGMEGLMMERTDSLLIWNNTIEFNSGVGIGLYRSSYNRIMHNRASYNVRGFSKFYRRGQDSADLLMYEQSSNNIVAYNVMTHGGDGLFLWAGQSTMDTGSGGANDNIFYGNDFSYSPANAIEATFSRNMFVSNIANYSDYGMWGGYSYDSKILGNSFFGNRTGIAIEHGQSNEIGENRFIGGQVAINLWANAIEPSDWGYPKHRNTSSRNYTIENNEIARSRVGLRLSATTGVSFVKNRFMSVDTSVVRLDSASVNATDNDVEQMQGNAIQWDYRGQHKAGLDTPLVKALPGAMNPLGDARDQLERDAIKVDEWGPYNWRYPMLWPADSTHGPAGRKLVVLGPVGSWRVVGKANIAAVSRDSGRIRGQSANSTLRVDTIEVTPTPGAENDWSLTLEYRGDDAITTARGQTVAAHNPYRFTYSRFVPITSWNVSIFAWPDSADPRTRADRFSALLKTTPLLHREEPRLDYMWYAPPSRSIPQSKWAAVATARVTLKPGTYTLRALSDDGARVYIDGKLAIDSWAPHETAVGNAPISPGTHEIRVEYYQVDGWSELRVEIVKGIQTSTGSPGPH